MKFAERLAQAALRGFFRATDGFRNMDDGPRKLASKNVHSLIADNDHQIDTFLLYLLETLGQMDHIRSKECNHPGTMSMPAETRRELINRCVSLLKREPCSKSIEQRDIRISELTKALEETLGDCRIHTCAKRNERIKKVLGK